MLSDQVGQCELYGVVDLFLGSTDEDDVQGPGHLRLEDFCGGEVGEESGEDAEDVSGGRDEGEISGQVDCHFHRNAVAQHLEHCANDVTEDIARHCLNLINRVPLQVELLELGGHLPGQLSHILLQQLIRLLAPDEIEVKVDDQR